MRSSGPRTLVGPRRLELVLWSNWIGLAMRKFRMGGFTCCLLCGAMRQSATLAPYEHLKLSNPSAARLETRAARLHTDSYEMLAYALLSLSRLPLAPLHISSKRAVFPAHHVRSWIHARSMRSACHGIMDPTRRINWSS